jgi:hypothetical protein
MFYPMRNGLPGARRLGLFTLIDLCYRYLASRRAALFRNAFNVSRAVLWRAFLYARFDVTFSGITPCAPKRGKRQGMSLKF